MSELVPGSGVCTRGEEDVNAGYISYVVQRRVALAVGEIDISAVGEESS